MLPRSEYPRPQFVRDEWLNLNGQWRFEIDQGVSGEARGLVDGKLSAEITVPFCPESRLSGVAHTDFIAACWYAREFDAPAEWLSGRLLMHFGAVYYECKVWVNGKFVGGHVGGYSSFSLDITRAARAGANTVTVMAISDVRSGRQPAGKQSVKYESAGCHYTRTTGIWQTVWLEPVPETYIKGAYLTPDAANGKLRVRLEMSRPGAMVKAVASYHGRNVGEAAAKAASNCELDITLSETRLWAPGAPELYDLTLEAGDDVMSCYFGLRDVCVDGASIAINGKNVFQRLVLDQGYNPEGIITAPSDEELKADIERSMALGFNGARLHQKIFEARYLYWADKLGYIVWGEQGNWGLDVTAPAALTYFLPEWLEAVRRDYSSPAVVGWCPFNETNRNTDKRVLKAVYEATKAVDSTRPVIDTSGWEHCGATDVFDYHDYTKEPPVFAEHVASYAGAKAGEVFPGCKYAPEYDIISEGQPIFVSEYGGIGFKLGSVPAVAWGYGKNATTEEEFLTRFKGLTDILLDAEGICGFCYTQLTDVEQEINGLYTYARELKFTGERIKAIVSRRAWNED